MGGPFINGGHGRKNDGSYDPGAVAGGVQEAAETLLMENEILPIFAFNGIQIAGHTQDGDLYDIVARANASGADMFISEHLDAYTTEQPSGTTVYICATGGQAEVFAKILCEEIAKVSGIPMRGVKTANFYVLTKTSMPAVLIENCFVTNPGDRAKVQDPAWRRAMQKAQVRAYCRWRGIPFKDPDAQTATPPQVPPTPPPTNTEVDALKKEVMRLTLENEQLRGQVNQLTKERNDKQLQLAEILAALAVLKKYMGMV